MAGKDKNSKKGRSSVAAAGLISGGVGVFLAVFMAVTANSIALWADCAATVIDFMAVLIAWWGLNKSEAGKTDAYHYGFGRFESLASMGMATLMIISFMVITGAAFIRFQTPVTVSGPGVLIGIVAHLVFGFINGRLTFRSLTLERREKSSLVTAQRRIFTLKLAANIMMFCSLVISHFFRDYSWSRYADPVAATIIGCTLLAGASKTFKFSIRDLLDCALEERSQLLIMRALVHHFDQYDQIHEIRTRCAGGKIYVEIFIEFAPDRLHGKVMETVRSLKEEIYKTIKCDEILVITV